MSGKMQLQNFDVADHIRQRLEFIGSGSFLDQFGGAVKRELSKVKIKFDLKLRPFTFENGDKGEVVDKLIIGLNFKDIILQPHSSFAEDLCGELAVRLEEEINGYYENGLDDMASDDDDTIEVDEEAHL